MTLRELIRAFREEIDDLPGDVTDPCAWEGNDTGLLWKNHELVRYANAAEKEFCRRRPIQDSTTTALCQIAVTAGTATYPYKDELIQYIERAQLDGETYPLTKKTSEWMDKNVLNWRTNTGTPVYYVEDMDDRQITLSPIPEADGTISTTIGRLPKTDMDWNKRQVIGPEIKSLYHENLMLWMGHLAFRKRDSQTYHENESKNYFDYFETAVGPRVNAHSEKRRRLSRNMPRRTRAYSF